MKRVNFRFALLPRLKLSGKDVSALLQIVVTSSFRILYLLVYLVSVCTYFCWVFLSVVPISMFHCVAIVLHAHTHIFKGNTFVFFFRNKTRNITNKPQQQQRRTTTNGQTCTYKHTYMHHPLKITRATATITYIHVAVCVCTHIHAYCNCMSCICVGRWVIAAFHLIMKFRSCSAFPCSFSCSGKNQYITKKIIE